MCLSCVHVKTKRDKHGYKVFKKMQGGYFYPGFHLSAKEIQDLEVGIEKGEIELFTPNKWMEDNADYDIPATVFMWDIPKGTECNRRYPTGMHVFLKEKDAKVYAKDTPTEFYGKLEVKKVKVQKIVASGYEESANKNGLVEIMVCKKLKIEN